MILLTLNSSLGLIMFAVVVVLTGGLLLRNRARASREGRVRHDEPFYDEMVRVRMRRRLTRGSWASLKNGFGGIYLTVSNDLIAVAPGGPLARFGGAFGIAFSFNPHDLSMREARVGWLGSPLFARDSIVISRAKRGKEVELSIVPDDHDLKRLQEALGRAGVQSTP